jgi:MYXO-CTERM domain-containing protein
VLPQRNRHGPNLDTLEIGGVNPASVSLVDLVDNQLDGAGSEALYVKRLIVHEGSHLDLGGINLYYQAATMPLSASITGGLFAVVPEPGALALSALAGAALIRRRPYGLVA